MICSYCQYQDFCKQTITSYSCKEIREKLNGKKIKNLKEFCDKTILSTRGYEKCCKWCDNEFVTNNYEQQFCSNSCEEQHLYYKENGIELPEVAKCLNCGEPLLFGNKFCSKLCRGEYERKILKERKEKELC